MIFILNTTWFYYFFFFFVAVQEEIFTLRVLIMLNKSLNQLGCFSSKNIKKVKVKLTSSILPFN